MFFIRYYDIDRSTRYENRYRYFHPISHRPQRRRERGKQQIPDTASGDRDSRKHGF